MDEALEWCNSFVLFPKAKAKVCWCLDPARLKIALIRPVHGGPTVHNILLSLADIKYLTLIYAS